MEKIIRANNIALPKLPAYQEYGYDVPSHSLMIMEYPDRKTGDELPQVTGTGDQRTRLADHRSRRSWAG